MFQFSSDLKVDPQLEWIMSVRMRKPWHQWVEQLFCDESVEAQVRSTVNVDDDGACRDGRDSGDDNDDVDFIASSVLFFGSYFPHNHG